MNNNTVDSQQLATAFNMDHDDVITILLNIFPVQFHEGRPDIEWEQPYEMSLEKATYFKKLVNGEPMSMCRWSDDITFELVMREEMDMVIEVVLGATREQSLKEKKLTKYANLLNYMTKEQLDKYNKVVATNTQLLKIGLDIKARKKVLSA